MAGKVREWMRRRMAPRRKPAATGTAAGSGDNSSGDESASAALAQSSSPRRKLVATAVPSTALRWRWRNVLAVLFQRAAYHLLWLVESVVVVAQLCFFFVRFGFRI